MALILRKAVLPKNMSLLKCMKGRPVATTSNKKNTAPLLSPALRQSYRKKSYSTTFKKMTRSQLLSIHCNKQPIINMTPNISCPSVIKQKTVVLRKFSCVSSSILTRNDNTNTNVTSKKYATPCDAGCFWAYGLCRKKSTCTCLPPPCNTPPRCLQYMTGYYYYPYGTWFCGPYHAVGPCPVSANGPACPCPKCCVACVCPNTKSSKSETALDQSKIQDSYPAKINCQTSPRLQKQKNEFELFMVKNSDNKDSESKQEKNVPPGLASMIYPNSNRPNDALGAGMQSSSSIPCTKSRSHS